MRRRGNFNSKQSGIFGLMADGSEVETVTSDCVGIICRDVNNDIEFIVGKTYQYTTWGYSGAGFVTPTNLPFRDLTSANESTIYSWYRAGYTGTANTDNIISSVSGNVYFTEYNCSAICCSKQTLSVAGKTLKGYLGCAAEMLFIKNNYTKFVSLYRTLISSEMTIYFYMSELQDTNNCWYIDINHGKFLTESKASSGGSRYTVPFFKLDRLA